MALEGRVEDTGIPLLKYAQVFWAFSKLVKKHITCQSCRGKGLGGAGRGLLVSLNMFVSGLKCFLKHVRVWIEINTFHWNCFFFKMNNSGQGPTQYLLGRIFYCQPFRPWQPWWTTPNSVNICNVSAVLSPRSLQGRFWWRLRETRLIKHKSIKVWKKPWLDWRFGSRLTWR